MPARLKVVRGPDIDVEYQVDEARGAMLGRTHECDVRVMDGATSRNHCRIQKSGAEWMVTDLGSRNGTFVNNKRVTESPLKPGDLLRVGGTVFTFVIDAGPGQEEAGGTGMLVEGTADAAPLEPEPELEVEGQPDVGGEWVAAVAPDEERMGEAEGKAAGGELVCVQCRRKLDKGAQARGEATEIGGRVYCSRCVVNHPESEAPKPAAEAEKKEGSESSEIGSLLQSLARATEADRLDNPPPAPPEPPKPPKKRPGLLDRLRGKKPKDE